MDKMKCTDLVGLIVDECKKNFLPDGSYNYDKYFDGASCNFLHDYDIGDIKIGSSTVKDIISKTGWSLDRIHGQVLSKLKLLNYKKISFKTLLRMCMKDVVCKILNLKALYEDSIDMNTLKYMTDKILLQYDSSELKAVAKIPDYEIDDIMTKIPHSDVLLSRHEIIPVAEVCDYRGFSRPFFLYKLWVEIKRIC